MELASESDEEVDKLATDLAFKHYSTPTVIDPYHISNELGIQVRKGRYGDLFDGIICCENDTFNIMLNMDQLRSHKYERARFTCAHELGHATIPSHRRELKAGNSFNFRGIEIEKDVIKAELQAQYFAAVLLMPEKWFMDKCAEVETVTMYWIYTSLKSEFKTSMTSTCKRFVQLTIKPVAFINIDNGVTSDVSSSLISVLGKRTQFIYNPNRSRIFVEEKIVDGGYTYTKSYTNLSSWTHSIQPNSSNDLFVQEELIVINKNRAFCMLVPVE